LKQKNVPGVFFVIGNMANQRPDILKREYAEAMKLGIILHASKVRRQHYTHGNPLQLNLTERPD